MSPAVYAAFEEICRGEAIVGPRCRWVMTPPRIIGWARKP